MNYEKLKERRLLMEDNKLIIYKNSEGNIIVDAIYKDETLWLSQKGMSKVFEVGVPAISKHLKNIFEENELDKNSVVSSARPCPPHPPSRTSSTRTGIFRMRTASPLPW